MFGTLGVPELLLILAIVVVLFGANRLPQLGKGLGSAIRNFKEGMNDGKNGPTEPHNS
jgi:sec-independent protein translocase protein TatA